MARSTVGLSLPKVAVGGLIAAAILGTPIVRALQRPAVRAIDEADLREYAGVYQWDLDSYV